MNDIKYNGKIENMNDELIRKYKLQYNNVSVYKNNSFHDRFI